MTNSPTALITGASRGIGLAISHELADTHHLLLGGRDDRALTELALKFPSAEAFCADLTDDADVARAAALVGSVDVLIHSAGVTDMGRVADCSREQWRNAFEINVFAVAQLTALLLPKLRQSKGQVILINSGSGMVTNPENSIYCGTKWALRAFGDVLREEERTNGVRVSSIHPGKVDTDMQRQIVDYAGGDYAPDFYLTPSSVAKAVRFAIDATDEAMVEMLSIRPVRR